MERQDTNTANTKDFASEDRGRFGRGHNRFDNRQNQIEIAGDLIIILTFNRAARLA
jgi:hypothetical protein